MISKLSIVAISALLCLSALGTADAASPLDTLKEGTITLTSIGPIGFGPDGILFVSDPIASKIYAIDTKDSTPGEFGDVAEIKGLDAKIAALIGGEAKDTLINDIAVNPISGCTYMSVSRGRGPDATPVLICLTPSGSLEKFDLDSVSFSQTSLWDGRKADRRGRDVRGDTITEVEFVNDTVIVAGLSNQEFASRLRAIPFPFSKDGNETGVEVFHTSHGRWETNAPIRTFTTHALGMEPYILAAYTCTPLVKIPLSSIVPGEKVVGTTVAELGNRNRPLDMLIYTQEGEEFLLVANNTRGVMKLAMDPIKTQSALTDRIGGVGGVPAETIDSYKGTEHFEAWGPDRALVLRRSASGSLDLTIMTLP